MSQPPVYMNMPPGVGVGAALGPGAIAAPPRSLGVPGAGVWTALPPGAGGQSHFAPGAAQPVLFAPSQAVLPGASRPPASMGTSLDRDLESLADDASQQAAEQKRLEAAQAAQAAAQEEARRKTAERLRRTLFISSIRPTTLSSYLERILAMCGQMRHILRPSHPRDAARGAPFALVEYDSAEAAVAASRVLAELSLDGSLLAVALESSWHGNMAGWIAAQAQEFGAMLAAHGDAIQRALAAAPPPPLPVPLPAAATAAAAGEGGGSAAAAGEGVEGVEGGEGVESAMVVAVEGGGNEAPAAAGEGCGDGGEGSAVAAAGDPTAVLVESSGNAVTAAAGEGGGSCPMVLAHAGGGGSAAATTASEGGDTGDQAVAAAAGEGGAGLMALDLQSSGGGSSAAAAVDPTLPPPLQRLLALRLLDTHVREGSLHSLLDSAATPGAAASPQLVDLWSQLANADAQALVQRVRRAIAEFEAADVSAIEALRSVAPAFAAAAGSSDGTGVVGGAGGSSSSTTTTAATIAAAATIATTNATSSSSMGTGAASEAVEATNDAKLDAIVRTELARFRKSVQDSLRRVRAAERRDTREREERQARREAAAHEAVQRARMAAAEREGDAASRLAAIERAEAAAAEARALRAADETRSTAEQVDRRERALHTLQHSDSARDAADAAVLDSVWQLGAQAREWRWMDESSDDGSSSEADSAAALTADVRQARRARRRERRDDAVDRKADAANSAKVQAFAANTAAAATAAAAAAAAASAAAASASASASASAAAASSATRKRAHSPVAPAAPADASSLAPGGVTIDLHFGTAPKRRATTLNQVGFSEDAGLAAAPVRGVRRLEYTAEETAAVMEQKRQLAIAEFGAQVGTPLHMMAVDVVLQNLATSLPTDAARMFAFPLDWSFIEFAGIVDAKLRPWVQVRVRDLLGEIESTVVDVIIGHLRAGVAPAELVRLLGPLGDDSADITTFVLKLWRKLAFEYRAALLGLQTPAAQ